MRRLTRACAVLCIILGWTVWSVQAAEPADCESFHIDSKNSKPLQEVANPPTGRCATRMSNGFPLPDPNCTPGAINTTLTTGVLRDSGFRTGCVRDNLTTENQKDQTYNWYNTPHPEQNTGVKQTCELDHLISLELGGGDGLENIWPQCGPSGVVLTQRYFRQKDMVENYLAARVKAGSIALGDAQRGIASDWTQYLSAAKNGCRSGKCKAGE